MDSRAIRVLNTFRPFILLLNAFNRDNFRHNNRRSNLISVFYLFAVIVLFISVPAVVILCIWYLIENEADFEEYIITLPAICSLVQMELTLCALILKCHIIIEMINRLQAIIERRKLLYGFFVWCWYSSEGRNFG